MRNLFFTLRTIDGTRWITSNNRAAELTEVGGKGPPPNLYWTHSTAANAKAQLERSTGTKLTIVPVILIGGQAPDQSN